MLPLRLRRSRLYRLVLGLMVSRLYLTLELSHPGVFHPEEVRLAGQNLPYILRKTSMLKTTNERFKGQGQVPETHLHGELQVTLNQLPSELSLLPGAFKLPGQHGELGHRVMSLPPKNVPELTL